MVNIPLHSLIAHSWSLGNVVDQINRDPGFFFSEPGDTQAEMLKLP